MNQKNQSNTKKKSLDELNVEIKYYNTKLEKAMEEAARLREEEANAKKIKLQESKDARKAQIESTLCAVDDMIKEYLKDYGELSISGNLYYVRTVFGHRPIFF